MGQDPSVEVQNYFAPGLIQRLCPVCLLLLTTPSLGLLFYLTCLCLLMSVPKCVATPKECLLPLMPLPMQLTETRSPCQSVFSGAMLSLLGSVICYCLIQEKVLLNPHYGNRSTGKLSSIWKFFGVFVSEANTGPAAAKSL